MSYLGAIAITGFLIFIHELGHFFAARSAGIPVERLSIGFGPSIYSFRRGGVEYALSLIPLGGYVLLAIEDEEDYFDLPLHKKIAFSIGGPAANIAFALLALATLGVMAEGFSVQAAIVGPMVKTIDMFAAIIVALSTLFEHPDQLSSIAGIVDVGGQFVEKGFEGALLFSALISLNLAVFNLLPVPPLDGGKIMMDTLVKIRPAFSRAYLPLTAAGWILLLGLMTYASVLDYGRMV